MKLLTEFEKKYIIRGILADTPKIDIGKMHKELQASIVEHMAPAVRELYKTHPHALQTCNLGEPTYLEVVVGDVDESTLDSLKKPYEVQDQAINDFEKKIRDSVAACTTLQQLEDLLPDFKKYFPTAEKPAWFPPPCVDEGTKK